MIEACKRLFIEEGGRTVAWKEEKRTKRAVRERKRGFLDIQKERLLAADASRNFYRNVKSFGKAEKPRLFNVKDVLQEGLSDEEAAAYFNRISDEF